MSLARPTPPSVASRLSDAHLLALAVCFHGLGDVATTALLWRFEANPFVAALGFGPWVGLKVVGLTALLAVWPLARSHWAARPVLGLFAALGVLVTLNNALVGGAVALA